MDLSGDISTLVQVMALCCQQGWGHRDSPTVWPLCAFFFVLLQFYVPFYVKNKKIDNFMCLLEFECAKRLKAHSRAIPGVNSIISTQLQLQLQRFQLQIQLQLRPISRISTPTPTPTPEVSTPTPIPTPANLQNINSNSNSNSNSGVSNPTPTSFQIQSILFN